MDYNTQYLKSIQKTRKLLAKMITMLESEINLKISNIDSNNPMVMKNQILDNLEKNNIYQQYYKDIFGEKENFLSLLTKIISLLSKTYPIEQEINNIIHDNAKINSDNKKDKQYSSQLNENDIEIIKEFIKRYQS